jgi:hypothetical protein
MSDVLSRFLIGVKATSQDMGFGTNSLVSGFGFGLIGKTLHLYSDRTWEVINKSGNVVATGDESEILGVKKVGDGFELTFSNAGKKRWLRVIEKQSILPWMGFKKAIDAMEGLLEYWRLGDHSVVVQEQQPFSSPVKYLGGAGVSLKSSYIGTLWITGSGFAMKSESIFWNQPIANLRGFQIGGQGLYTTGGGWVGGGVGFNGAMMGASMANFLNVLETRVHNDCLMRLSFETAELNFQILDLTPSDMELKLAPVRLYLENNLGVISSSTMGLSGTIAAKGFPNKKDLKTKLQELKNAYEEGLLSEAEYQDKREDILGDL